MLQPSSTRFMLSKPTLSLMLGAALAVLPSRAPAQSVCKADEIQVTAGKNLYCMHAAPKPLAASAADSYCNARKQNLLSMFTLAALWNVDKDATAKMSPLLLDKKIVVRGIPWSKILTERYRITTPVRDGLRNLPAEPYKAQVLDFVCSSDIPVALSK